MKILIFGATGFIGRNLSVHLKEKNHQITIITRSVEKANLLFPQNIEIVEWNFTDEIKLSEIINQKDIIINLAGENIASKLWTKKQKRNILKSRVNLGEKITKAVKLSRIKPRTLIQFSAIGYYGYNLNYQCNESCNKGEGFLAEVCEKWEQSTELTESFGIKRIIIRTGIVLGKNGGMFSKLLIPIKYFLGSNFGNGNNSISWIHIDDLIYAIEYLINRDEKGIFNLTAPSPVKARELNKTIAKKLRRPVWLKIPKFIPQLLLGKMADEVLLSNQRVIPDRLLKIGFQFKYNTITNAVNSLIVKGR